MLDSYIKWFQAHERLAIILAVMAFSSWGFSRWLDKSAMDARVQAAVAEQVAAEQKLVNAKLAEQVQQQTALFQQAEIQREKEMTALVAAMASRDAASSKKVTEVSAPKTPPQAVADLTAAYPLLPIPLVPTDMGANVPTVDLQQFTVAKIERDTAVADLRDTKEELKVTDVSLTQAVGLVDSKSKQIDGLLIGIDKDAKACEAEKKSLKDDARKGKWKWFWSGLVVGFLGRSAIPK